MGDAGKEEEKKGPGLDERDIQILQTYVRILLASDAPPPKHARVATHLNPLPSIPPPSFHLVQGVGPYHHPIRKLEADIESEMKKISELIGALIC
jgi:hypothetical protein